MRYLNAQSMHLIAVETDIRMISHTHLKQTAWRGTPLVICWYLEERPNEMAGYSYESERSLTRYLNGQTLSVKVDGVTRFLTAHL